MGKTLFRAGALLLSLGVFGLLLWRASQPAAPPPVVAVAPVDAAVAPTPKPEVAQPGGVLRELASPRGNGLHLGATKSDPHLARMLAEEAFGKDGGVK
jgi:hypothetical protein